MVRFLILAGLLAASTTATAAPKSDPGFLGIEMATGQSPFGCQVSAIIPNGGAEDAGIRAGEIVFKIDEIAIPNCQKLVEIVSTRIGGDLLKFELGTLSGGPHRSVVATLTTRSELVRRQLVGKPLDIALVSTDDSAPLDLTHKRKPTIVGWFGPGCDCRAIFDRLVQYQKKSSALIYGVTYKAGFTVDMLTNVGVVRDNYKLDVPLALTNDPFQMRSLSPGGSTQMSPLMSMFDNDRVMLAVLDARGDVSYVATVSPGSDDLDAVFDDVFVAVDSATRKR